MEIQCKDGYTRKFSLHKGGSRPRDKRIYTCFDCKSWEQYGHLQEHTCKEAIKNQGRLYDRWGEYFLLTGHESIDTCFWCGVRTKRRYCSDDCRINYLRHYSWFHAS